MTHMTRDDFARLLARARTVIADAAPTAHILCDELAQWTCNGFVPVTHLIMPPWLQTRAG